MPNWLNVRPSWQLDDPTTEYTKAFQVANEVRLAPLKYQQAKNAIAEQNLSIANQGIQNQRQSMLLGLDAATMPEKINQVKTEGQILSMKLNSARSEQAAWERDAPKISDWMALPWEQRVKAPAPRVESTKAIETITAQEKADSTNALQKQAHDASLANAKLAAEKGRQQAKFMEDVAKAGFDSGELDQLEKTFVNGEPTQQSSLKFSELKDAQRKRVKTAEPFTYPDLPGYKFIRQPTGHVEIVQRPDRGLSSTARVSVQKTIARLNGKMLDPLIDDESKKGIQEEIRGLREILSQPDKPSVTPSKGTPITSKAAYDALPSGSEFIGSDGETYKKP